MTYVVYLDGAVYAVTEDYYQAHAFMTEAAEHGHAWMEAQS